MVQGIVTAFDSLSLVGADIIVKSTKQVVLTDTLGGFSVLCNPNDAIVVKAKGFNNQKVKIKPNVKFVAVNMKIKQGEKNREYAIGYGNATDREKMYALLTLNNNDVDFSNYSNMYELIQGRFTGVQVSNGEIIIRGINTVQGDVAAMIIIDGVNVDGQALRELSPNQVESIDILKDGAAAIYGARGAQGVVIVKTKSGE
jgi:TonB-dependent SusC/RagA subfamily outer membrane receptor